MTRSFTLAWEPVPLTGQSSSTWPALRSARSALALSSILKVLASTITRGGTRAATMAATVWSSADGLGRLVMMVGTAAARLFASLAISTPGPRHGAAAGRVDVVAHHAPAAGNEVFGKRAAHDAEADDADGPLASRHSHSPSPL